jgi:hypothetical protein
MQHAERHVDRDCLVGHTGQRPASNPGVFALWVTRSYTLGRFRDKLPITMGDPESVIWWTRGRPATDVRLRLGSPSQADIARNRAQHIRGLKHQGVLSDLANGLPTVFQRHANALPTGCVFQPPYPQGRWNSPPVGRRANAHGAPLPRGPEKDPRTSRLASWRCAATPNVGPFQRSRFHPRAD